MRLPIAAAALAAALILTCCSSEGPERARAQPARTARANLPTKILGLRVVEEKITEELDEISQAYLRSIGLFSFREDDDLLRATLQVGEFNDIASNQRERFRDSIIGQLGSTVPIELRVGRKAVFLSAGNEQSLYSWFEPDGFLVLSVRSDYPFSRTLLRRLIGTEVVS